MANTLLTIDMITRSALELLVNNLKMTSAVNRQYDSSFAKTGAKIGSALRVRKPVRYVAQDGATLVNQDAKETYGTLNVTTQTHVGLRFTAEEFSLHIDDFRDRFLVSAMETLANKIDFGIAGGYKDIYNQVGTPGTTPNSFLSILNVGRRLNEEAVPMGSKRSLILNEAAEATLINAMSGFFNPSQEIGAQYRTGTMGNASGFKISMDQNINTHTVGVATGTPLTNGVPAEGATTLVTDGWTNSTTGILKQGDVFTIADVYAVNPQNRQSTGVLRQFVVTADVNSGASTGPATISISPAIYSSAVALPNLAYQTVDALPADGKAITVIGSGGTQYPINLGLHEDGIILATADLEVPQRAEFGARAQYKGLSLRIVRDYDITNDRFPCRADILWGYEVIRPELCCRLIG